MLTETLRLELVGEPIRVSEIAPGMVQTDEFALVRFDGDAEKADAVYAGVPNPLVAEDVADAIAWIATRPVAREHRRAGDPSAGASGPAQGAPHHLSSGA